MGLDPYLYLYDLKAGLAVDHEHAQQNISNPHFASYLYEHSPWIEELFTFMIPLTGGSLEEEFSRGEGKDEVFGRGELERLLKELQAVPRPGDDQVFLAWNYDHLLLLIKAARSRPHLTLARAIY
jgi:hypothetical protein